MPYRDSGELNAGMVLLIEMFNIKSPFVPGIQKPLSPTLSWVKVDKINLRLSGGKSIECFSCTYL